MRVMPVALLFVLLMVLSFMAGYITHDDTKPAELLIPALPIEASTTHEASVTQTQGEEMIERTAMTCEHCEEKDAEIARLRLRVAALEAVAHPTTQGQIAVLAGIPEADLQHMLDASELLPNAAVLAEAAHAVGATNVVKALRLEAGHYTACAQFKGTNPAPEGGRREWHYAVWSPFLTAEIERVVQGLYVMGMPSPIVEPFRNRLTEGL